MLFICCQAIWQPNYTYSQNCQNGLFQLLPKGSFFFDWCTKPYSHPSDTTLSLSHITHMMSHHTEALVRQLQIEVVSRRSRSGTKLSEREAKQ
jgi:hypothetical protein